MCDPAVILRLYTSVLHDHQIDYEVNEADIRTAIQNMKEVYKPNPTSLTDTIVMVADYNDAAHRIAYLHKYAPFHTALVADMLQKVLQQNPKLLKDLIYPSRHINICSLGGGPGSDIFGVLSLLTANFGLFQVSATVIDCMGNWQDLFAELITELRYGNYGALGECVDEQYFDWNYLQHNLLTKMTNQVNQAIARANLVTMIKFVSASSCKDTPAMIRKIFRTVKPGSLVLFIDNAGGGFHQVLRKEAQNCSLKTVFGPLMHQQYINHDFNIKRFGYTPCLESKVTVQIWRKFGQNTNTHSSELNEPLESRIKVNALPAVRNINQSKITQANYSEPKRQIQKSNVTNSRAIHNFSSPESVSNQRQFQNVNTLPAIRNTNQPKVTQASYSEPKRQIQKSNVTSSRTIYSFPSPESVNNQRQFQNVPNASSHFTYEYCQRVICSQSSYSYLPGTQSSAPNHSFNPSRTGSRLNEPAPQLPAIHSQPRSITSTSLQPERNRIENRLVENQNVRENDCCSCCVIS